MGVFILFTLTIVCTGTKQHAVFVSLKVAYNYLIIIVVRPIIPEIIRNVIEKIVMNNVTIKEMWFRVQEKFWEVDPQT